MSKRLIPEQWRTTLSEFHSSCQSQTGFCSEHGLSVSSLQYQLRRERSRADGPEVEDSFSPRLVSKRR